MEDSLEDEILYQTYISHMNKFTFILPFIPQRLPTLNYAFRILRLYLLKPEVFIVTFVSIVLLVYLQTANNLWGRPVIARLQNGLSKSTFSCPQLLGKTIKSSNDSSWCTVGENAAVFAIQGRRPHMEDRFVLAENFGDSGVSMFAVFDGHGGEVCYSQISLFIFNTITLLDNNIIYLSKLCNFPSQLAANFATDKMSSSIQAKILEAKDVSKKGAIPKESENNGNEPTSTPNTPTQNMEDKKSKGISK
jgi:hypothetical protein